MKQQRGAAIVIVMFIVALAAIIAAEMASNLMIQVQKSMNIQAHQQSKWYSYAAEELAKKTILDSKEKDKDKVHLDQAWAKETPPFPVDDGELAGEITDLQACLNLNALRAEKEENSTSKTNPAHEALLALLTNIEDLPADESEEAMADSVYDWLDQNSNTFRSGAEEDEYLSRQIPYLAANNLFASVSELRVIKGFNPLVMEKVLPYVCVIPGSTELAINVNTIQSEQALLLTAFIPELTESSAEAVISARPDDGFDDVNAFYEEVKNQGGNSAKKSAEIFTVNSNYFQLRATALFDQRRFTMTSIISINNGEATVMARKFGGVQ